MKNIRGFTLLEVLISTALSLILVGVVGRSFLAQQTYFEQQSNVVETQENARTAMQMMFNELIMAGYNPTGSPPTCTGSNVVVCAGIHSISPTSIRFKMDLNGNSYCGGTGESDEDVQYSYNSTTKKISRSTNGGVYQPLAENISALTFSYYKSDGTTATTASDVRKIKVQLTAKINTQNYERTFSCEIKPRNLGLAKPATSSTTSTTSTTSTSTSTPSTSSGSSSIATTSIGDSSTSTSDTTSSTSTSTTSSTTSTTTSVMPCNSLSLDISGTTKQNGKPYIVAYVTLNDSPANGATVNWTAEGCSQSGGGTTGTDGYFRYASGSSCSSFSIDVTANVDQCQLEAEACGNVSSNGAFTSSTCGGTSSSTSTTSAATTSSTTSIATTSTTSSTTSVPSTSTSTSSISSTTSAATTSSSSTTSVSSTSTSTSTSSVSSTTSAATTSTSTTISTTTVSTTSTTSTTTTIDPCSSLSLDISGTTKQNGNKPIHVVAYLTNNGAPVSGASISWTTTGTSGCSQSGSGTTNANGYYDYTTSSNCNSNFSITVTATTTQCTAGKRSCGNVTSSGTFTSATCN
ncbi:MAG: prepilin-type N-terminal cleavage/methylation domain-containing protein [Desulfobacterales bacterium]|nr:prepilin-type N-terminal cleavage/methylation domain-containing protein [Desulfobacterales bacterium]